MMNYELMDEILKQLEDVKSQVNNAEEAYGEIISEEIWKQVFAKLYKLIKLDSKQ